MRGTRGTTLLIIGLLIGLVLVLQGCPSLIPNRAPSAEFTANPTSGKVPLTVQFDASASSDPDKDSPDGDIVSYEWDFGDGDTATGETVDHTYGNDGRFTAKLTVTDGQDASDSASKTIDVSAADNRPPNASFTANPTSGTAPLTVNFDASGSSDPDGSIQGYEWAFGDGSSGSGETVSHTYNTSGTFTAILTVSDGRGATDSDSITLNIGPKTTPTTNAWPMFKHDAQRQNRSPFSGPQQANTKWIFRDDQIDCCGIGNEGTVYVGSDEGLYAIATNATRKWLNSTFVPVSDPAVGPSGRIFVVASFPNQQKENLVALDEQGNVLWRFENINTYYKDTRIAIGSQGELYYFTDCWDTSDQMKHSSLLALDGQDGSIQWVYDVTENRTLSNGQCAASPGHTEEEGTAPPALDEQGNIYFGFQDRLISLSPLGAFRWDRSFAEGPAGGISIADDGTLYAAYADTLFSIDPATPQQTNWRKEFTDNPLHGNSMAIGPNERVHIDIECVTFSCVHNMMFTFDDQGTLLWRNDPVAGKKAVGKNGTVYGDSLTDIVAINPDGTQQWRTNSPCSNSGVAIGPDGTLYVGGSDALCAFERQ